MKNYFQALLNKIRGILQSIRLFAMLLFAITKTGKVVKALNDSPWMLGYRKAGLGEASGPLLWQLPGCSNTLLQSEQMYDRWVSDQAAGYRLTGYSSAGAARAASGRAFFDAQQCLIETNRLDRPFIGAAMVGAVTSLKHPGKVEMAFRTEAGEANQMSEISLRFTRGLLGRMGEDLAASLVFLAGLCEVAGLPPLIFPQTFGMVSPHWVRVPGGYRLKPALFTLTLTPEQKAQLESERSLVIHRDGHITGLRELNFAQLCSFGTSARPAHFAHRVICAEFGKRSHGEVVVEITASNPDPSKPAFGIEELLRRASQFAGVATVIIRLEGGLFIDKAREIRILMNEQGKQNEDIRFLVGADTMKRVVDKAFCDRFGGVKAVLEQFLAVRVKFVVMPRDDDNGKTAGGTKPTKIDTLATVLTNLPSDEADLLSQIAAPFDLAPMRMSSSMVRSAVKAN